TRTRPYRTAALAAGGPVPVLEVSGSGLRVGAGWGEGGAEGGDELVLEDGQHLVEGEAGQAGVVRGYVPVVPVLGDVEVSAHRDAEVVERRQPRRQLLLVELGGRDRGLHHLERLDAEPHEVV